MMRSGAGGSPSQSPAVTALPKGEPLAKPMDCQGLSLWERWHCISNDGEGEDAARERVSQRETPGTQAGHQYTI